MVTCHRCEAGWHCLMGPAVQERMGERTKGHGISIFASYSIHKSAECSKSLIWQQKTNPWFGWEHRKLLRLLWYYFKDPKVSSAPFRLDKNPLLSLIRQKWVSGEHYLICLCSFPGSIALRYSLVFISAISFFAPSLLQCHDDCL